MSTSEYITVASIVAGFCSLAWQTRAKRNDEKRTAQLKRLSEQLSDLYGPLYALYEAGERNWMRFINEYSNDDRVLSQRTLLPSANNNFKAPSEGQLTEYRRRMKQLFMPTNIAMEAVIVGHADLVVGTQMPEQFSDFLAHVAAAKLVVHRWKTDSSFTLDSWEHHRIEYPHPDGLKHIIRASFEILKQTQQRVLTGELEFVDEKTLEKEIGQRMELFISEWNERGPSYASKLKIDPALQSGKQ